MNSIIGEDAPDFSLQNTEGEKVRLSDFRGKKNIVLLFFPLAFSSVCTNEMHTIRDNMKLYSSLDAKVIAISVDSFFSLREFKKAENINFTLLSDFNKEASKKYNALYDDYYGMQGVSKRAAFLISREGEVVYSEVLEDSRELPDFDAIQKELQKL